MRDRGQGCQARQHQNDSTMTRRQRDVASNSPIPCTPDGLTGETGSKRRRVPIKHHQEDQGDAVLPFYTALSIGTASPDCQIPPPPNAHLEHLDGSGYHAALARRKLHRRRIPSSCLPKPDDRQNGPRGVVWCMAQDYRPGWAVWGSQYPSELVPRVCVCGNWEVVLDGCAPVISCVL